MQSRVASQGSPDPPRHPTACRSPGAVVWSGHDNPLARNPQPFCNSALGAGPGRASVCRTSLCGALGDWSGAALSGRKNRLCGARGIWRSHGASGDRPCPLPLAWPRTGSGLCVCARPARATS